MPLKRSGENSTTPFYGIPLQNDIAHRCLPLAQFLPYGIGRVGGSRPLRRLAASPNLVAKDQCDTHGERVEIERSELPQPNGQLNLLRCEVNFG